MFLKNLHLTNFKSYTEASFAFNSNVNGVVGANGSGKTNLLDAIHYLSFGKSCFSAKDVSSVRLGTDFFALHGDFAFAQQYSKDNGTIKADLQKDLDRINKSGIPRDIRFNQGLDVLGLK